jgi:hypothetical protein
VGWRGRHGPGSPEAKGFIVRCILCFKNDHGVHDCEKYKAMFPKPKPTVRDHEGREIDTRHLGDDLGKQARPADPWVCPACGVGVAPWSDVCPYCIHQKTQFSLSTRIGTGTASPVPSEPH